MINLFENLQNLKEIDKSVKISNKNYKRTLKEIIDVISTVYEKELIPKQCNEIIEDIYYKVIELKEMFDDIKHEKMIKESDDMSKEDVKCKLISLVQDNLPGELADRAGSSYFYTQGKQHFMAIPVSPHSDSFDFYSYEKDLKKVFPKLPIYSMMDDYEMLIDVTRFYRELTESNEDKIINVKLIDVEVLGDDDDYDAWDEHLNELASEYNITIEANGERSVLISGTRKNIEEFLYNEYFLDFDSNHVVVIKN